MSKKRVTKWRTITCSSCGGHGTVADYSWMDFEGAKECDECGGNGYFFISPSERCFLYPGGPARGMWLGAYALGRDVRRTRGGWRWAV